MRRIALPSCPQEGVFGGGAVFKATLTNRGQDERHPNRFFMQLERGGAPEDSVMSFLLFFPRFRVAPLHASVAATTSTVLAMSQCGRVFYTRWA